MEISKKQNIWVWFIVLLPSLKKDGENVSDVA